MNLEGEEMKRRTNRGRRRLAGLPDTLLMCSADFLAAANHVLTHCLYL